VFVLQYPANNIMEVPWGASGDIPVAGNWLLEGFQVGVYRQSTAVFYLRSPSWPGGVIPLPWGSPGDLPVVGRWTVGDPYTNVGYYRPSTREFLLRKTDGTTIRRVEGNFGDLPLAG